MTRLTGYLLLASSPGLAGAPTVPISIVPVVRAPPPVLPFFGALPLEFIWAPCVTGGVVGLLLNVTGGLIGSQPPQVLSWIVVVPGGAVPLELVLVTCVPGGAACLLLVVAGGCVWYQPLPPPVVCWFGIIRVPVVGLLLLGFLFVVAGGLVISQPP